MQESHNPERTPRRAWRILALALLLVGLLGSFHFALRSYGTYTLLRSAYELGVPSTSALRAWMTLDYISKTYQVPLDRLMDGIGVAATITPETSLFRLAEARGQPRIELVRRAQAVIAEVGAAVPAGEASADETGETSLSALLAYSYPALAAILLLGAVGAPVPTGFATVLAGALASDGTMNWPLATSIAVLASVGGDVVGYGFGRLAGENVVSRYGHYVGYAGKHKARIEALFARWGALTVLLTRTLVSHLSSVASVLAGLSRYAFVGFIVFAVAGRVIWTAAYFGVGYYVGTDIEASSSFLGSVTGLAISLSVTAISARYLLRWRRIANAARDKNRDSV